MGKIPILTEQAWQKIKHYCNYSERCHFEVKEKLYAMGLPKKQVEVLICRLIDENLLNEERFARMFAGGHFRQKKWGRTKIIYALRQKKLGENLIKMALREIETADYTASLQKLAAAKWKTLDSETLVSKQARTRAYLLQKGYESGLIQAVIKELSCGKKD